MRRRYSAEQWLEWLVEQPESGLNIARFCDSIGVSPNSFYLWRRKLRKELKSAKRKRLPEEAAPTFVPVEVLDANLIANHLVVEMPCGATAKVPADASSLKLVFQTLLEIGGQS